MYNPSQRFLNLIDSGTTFAPKSKIVVAGVEYTGETHLKTWPRIEHRTEKIIGGFPAKTCSFEIWNRDGSIDLHGQEVEVWRGLEVGGITVIDSPYVISTSISGWGTSSVIIVIKAFDTVVKFGFRNTVTGVTVTNESAGTDNGDGTRTWTLNITIISANLASITGLLAICHLGSYGVSFPILEKPDVEWIPMGIFTAKDEDIQTSKTGSFITFSGADRSRAFEQAYGGELEYPVSLGAFVQDICDRAGIGLETPDFPLYDLALPDRPNIPEGFPERELIARAAELGGCIAQISRAGGLRITREEDTGRTIAPLLYKSLLVAPDTPDVIEQLLALLGYIDSKRPILDGLTVVGGVLYWNGKPICACAMGAGKKFLDGTAGPRKIQGPI